MVFVRQILRRISSAKSGGMVRSKIFGRYLIITNTLTSGTLMGLGDVIMQNAEKKKEAKPFDWKRTGRMATIGILLGPFIHTWYAKLDQFLPGNQKKTIVKKVVADQLIASPSFLGLFFIGMGELEGRSFQESVNELKEKFIFMYLLECLVWPPAQAFNFYVLPPHLRVVYVNMLVLIWDCFLSYMKHKDEKITSLINVHASEKPLP